MLFKNIWYLIRKANIILFPILPLNGTKILKTIDILCCLIKHLYLKDKIQDKVVQIKDNCLNV